MKPHHGEQVVRRRRVLPQQLVGPNGNRPELVQQLRLFFHSRLWLQSCPRRPFGIARTARTAGLRTGRRLQVSKSCSSRNNFGGRLQAQPLGSGSNRGRRGAA